MTKRSRKSGKTRTLTPEEAEKLVDKRGTDVLGFRQNSFIYMTLNESEALKYLRTCARVVLEPTRELPSGCQVVLYTGKKIAGYFCYTAEKAEALISGELTFPEPKPPVRPKKKSRAKVAQLKKDLTTQKTKRGPRTKPPMTPQPETTKPETGLTLNDLFDL